MSAEEVAARITSAPDITQPWPHAIIDDFLPTELFAELLAWLPKVDAANVQKFKSLPRSTLDLLTSEVVTEAIRRRFNFDGGEASIDVAFRRTGLKAHPDRSDKPWSGLIYLAGDPKGTELYDAAGKFAKTVEWKPNRLVCWAKRPKQEQHAVPPSDGRFVLVWWFLRTRAKG